MATSWKNKSIVHLDDHEIVLTGIEQCLKDLAPDINIKSYSDSSEVFDLLMTSITNNPTVDLFITDFIHSGLDGYEMCAAIRARERNLEKRPIPILLLTMIDPGDPMIQKGLKEKTFNTYLSLNNTPATILREIEVLLKLGSGIH